jgi:hypothetical protein
LMTAFYCNYSYKFEAIALPIWLTYLQ